MPLRIYKHGSHARSVGYDIFTKLDTSENIVRGCAENKNRNFLKTVEDISTKLNTNVKHHHVMCKEELLLHVYLFDKIMPLYNYRLDCGI